MLINSAGLASLEDREFIVIDGLGSRDLSVALEMRYDDSDERYLLSLGLDSPLVASEAPESLLV